MSEDDRQLVIPELEGIVEDDYAEPADAQPEHIHESDD